MNRDILCVQTSAAQQDYSEEQQPPASREEGPHDDSIVRPSLSHQMDVTLPDWSTHGQRKYSE
ncbi:hypothetical protein [Dyella sp. AD56]|uniref:hypothetical protein n=1 Tax=Dyella sp. AD56 TaxID=1528744 RepID=UPI001E585CD0|nr:hypothetical protein [Dyella sp. AD56]